MTDIKHDRRAQMFPTLTPAQIERIEKLGTRRKERDRSLRLPVREALTGLGVDVVAQGDGRECETTT